jgi:hypothetical protein
VEGIKVKERPRYQIDDTVELKKPHPCGSHLWRIWRTGIDFGLRCEGCGHRIMISRKDFERAVRKHFPAAGAAESEPSVP